jgi:hypothetical protein
MLIYAKGLNEIYTEIAIKGRKVKDSTTNRQLLTYPLPSRRDQIEAPLKKSRLTLISENPMNNIGRLRIADVSILDIFLKFT